MHLQSLAMSFHFECADSPPSHHTKFEAVGALREGAVVGARRGGAGWFALDLNTLGSICDDVLIIL